MKFELKKPCEHCPFRTDLEPYLSGTERAQEIVEGLDRGVFPCHKTVDHEAQAAIDEWDDGHEPEYMMDENNQFCAGALIMLEKCERPGQMMRIAERLGSYDRTKLVMDSPVFDTPEDFVRAQAREE